MRVWACLNVAKRTAGRQSVRSEAACYSGGSLVAGLPRGGAATDRLLLNGAAFMKRKMCTTSVKTIDLPLESVTGVAWRPLNGVDLQIVARRTVWTFSATPSSQLPPPVAEAIGNIVAGTVAERRGVRHPRYWDLLIPTTAPEDPDDFPVDPLGVAVWPWREQLKSAGWDAVVAEAPTPFGPAMIIGFQPFSPPSC